MNTAARYFALCALTRLVHWFGHADVAVCTSFLMAQSYAGFSVFYGWLSNTFPSPPAKRAVALAFINSVSQMGNVAGSYVWQPASQTVQIYIIQPPQQSEAFSESESTQPRQSRACSHVSSPRAPGPISDSRPLHAKRFDVRSHPNKRESDPDEREGKGWRGRRTLIA